MGRGIPQRILAQRCGITPTYLSLVENGKSLPSLELIDRICRELAITEREFYRSLYLSSLSGEPVTVWKQELQFLMQELLKHLPT